MMFISQCYNDEKDKVPLDQIAGTSTHKKEEKRKTIIALHTQNIPHVGYKLSINMVYVLHLYHSVTLIPDEELTTESNIHSTTPQQRTIWRTMLEQNTPLYGLSLNKFVLQHFSTSLNFIKFPKHF